MKRFSFLLAFLLTGCASHTFKDYDSLVKPSAVKRLQSGETTEVVYLSIRQYAVTNGVINLISVSNALPSGMYWLWHDTYGFWQPHHEFIATNTARSIPHVLQVGNSNVFQARYFAVGGTNLVPPYSFALPVVFDPPPGGDGDPIPP